MKRGIIFSILIVSLLLLVACQTEDSSYTLEEMQVCEVDADCVYVDNSCCPNTNGDNIYAINSEFSDYYLANGEDCGDNYACIEIYTSPAIAVLCLDNVCTNPLEYVKAECEDFCSSNDKSNWDNMYELSATWGGGSACDGIFELAEWDNEECSLNDAVLE